jgi:hypothetical protein
MDLVTEAKRATRTGVIRGALDCTVVITAALSAGALTQVSPRRPRKTGRVEFLGQ